MKIITLSNINKSYNGQSVLKDFYLQVNKGDKIALSSPSGAGKTTLANIIAGLIKPDNGKIKIDSSLQISYLFQEDRLLPWISAYKNVHLCNRSAFETDYFFQQLQLNGAQDKYPAELSGGMNRRISLARALAFTGDFFIFDEPLKGLDQKLKESVLFFLKDYLKEATFLLITHDLEEANVLCNKQILIEQ